MEISRTVTNYTQYTLYVVLCMHCTSVSVCKEDQAFLQSLESALSPKPQPPLTKPLWRDLSKVIYILN